MAYRDGARGRDEGQVAPQITGADDQTAQAIDVFLLAFVLACAQCVRGPSALAFVATFAVATVWYLLDLNTRRFVFTTDGDEIVVRSKLLGVLTVSTRRFDLGSNLWFDDGADLDDRYAAPGFTLTESSSFAAMRTARSTRFGSARDVAKSKALFEQMNALVAQARRERASLDSERERDGSLGALHRYWSALDPETIEHNSWGRVRRATLASAVDHEVLGTIPAGSVLEFTNDEEYRSRSVRDELTAVTLSQPNAVLYEKLGLSGAARPSLPGAIVRFGARYAQREGSSGALSALAADKFVPTLDCERAFESASIGEIAIDGAAHIGTANGVPCACTLAQPVTIHAITFAPGSSVTVDSMNNVTFESVNDVVIGERTTKAPAHVHFYRKRGRGASTAPITLAEALRERGAMLAFPTHVHTVEARSPAR